MTLDKKDISNRLKEHKDIIIFMLSIATVHFLWKIGSNASVDDTDISFYGISFTRFFDVINVTWANMTYAFIHLIDRNNISLEHNLLTFSDNESQVCIVWGCSGVKELIMTLVMLLLARGSIKKKLWYIPMGLAFIIVINYLRLIILTYAAHYSYELFDVLHSYLGRIMMYGGIIALWYIWIERMQTIKTKLN